MRTFHSYSHARLVESALAFLERHSESLLLLPNSGAAEALLRSVRGSVGVHHRTMVQIAAELARPRIAERNLAPLTSLGAEAVLARVVFDCRHDLKYFQPVS